MIATTIQSKSARLLLHQTVGLKQFVGVKGKGNVKMSTSPLSSPKKKAPQVNLPRLPVPALNDTLSKYLRTVKPLLNSDEFEKCSRVVKDFGTKDGPKLQGLLENRANAMDNWMADWWLNTAYLEYRDPVVIFSSPGLVFPLQNFKSLDDQLSYASKMIYGALLYKDMIDTEKIKPDFMGKLPLDMSQYDKIFGTTRNPKKPRDQLVYHPGSRHIVVAFKNYFYKVDVVGEGGKLKSPVELFAELNRIVESTEGLNGIPLGILTSENRDAWADAYDRLKQDPKNAASLKVIEESLFIISLDRPNREISSNIQPPASPEIEDTSISEKQTIAALQMIHGNNTNSGNRWFDKTVSFIVGSDGEVGLTYEHSPAEGPPIANMMDFIVQYMKESEKEVIKRDLITNKIESKVNPQSLEFNLNDKEVTTAIAKAKGNLESLVRDLQIAPFTFRKYGREFIKTCKMSPDSFIQMAIQAAFYRLHGVPAAHYESASVRMFIGGRTECIRSCSIDSLEFSQALLDSALSLQDKYKIMKNAVEGHKKYAGDAVQAQGVDRHLLGLKKIAIENGLPIPDLFADKGYTKSTHFRLSTSQVPSLFEAFMCYAPLTNDGYGCCYNPIKNSIVFGVSAFKSNPETDAHKFKKALQETLLEMEKVGSMASMQSKL